MASGVGNTLMAVGARTGRDGIHGATFASEELSEDSDEASRPQVQVGDPFTEKLLLEASLELIKSGHIVGIQDMGAAGLTSSASEMAGRGGSGVVIDTSLVPVREPGMTPYEILLSESQERMLVVAHQGHEDAVRHILEKWELEAAVIGHVTDDGRFRVQEDGVTVADIPAMPLTEGCPTYEREGIESDEIRALREKEFPELLGLDGDLTPEFMKLLASPNISSKRWIYEQYDSTVRASTVTRSGGRLRSDPDSGHEEGGGGHHGLQRAVRLPVSPPRGPGRRGGGGPEPRVRRRGAGGHHQQPELRQPPQAPHLLPTPRGRARHGRSVPHVRDPGHRR